MINGMGRQVQVHQHEEGTSPSVCLGMSLLAGLSTTLGAGVVFMLPGQRPTKDQMAFSLALAGGVMLSVTVLEFWLPMLQGGKEPLPVIVCSLLGAVAFLILSFCVPEPDIGHAHAAPAGVLQPNGRDIEKHVLGFADSSAEKLSDDEPDTVDLKLRSARLSLVLMLSLTAHNFPEGFAVAVSATESNRMGLIVMIAIAIHNIPEGIAIAVPVLVATGSKRRAMWMSFLSGMAEPIGALSALAMLRALGAGGLSESSMEYLLCVVGGVMCAVALKELLPEACRQGSLSAVCFGVVLGFALMWFTSKLGA